MRRRHEKQELLEAAMLVARQDGLSRLSFGRVAKVLGIHDRTVVYYFPTKDALVGEVLVALGGQLQDALGDVGVGLGPGHRDILRAAWPVLARGDVDPVLALFFEATGLAAAGTSPYDGLVPALVSGWVDWAEARLSGTGPERRAEAEAAVALIDGLLLFRQVAGADAADRAAQRLLAAAG